MRGRLPRYGREGRRVLFEALVFVPRLFGEFEGLEKGGGVLNFGVGASGFGDRSA
jgi:hypothetical protein